LSRKEELRPEEGEDDVPIVMIPEEKFAEVAALEENLDMEEIWELFIAAVMISDEWILEQAKRAYPAFEKIRPAGMVLEEGLWYKDGRVWIPDRDGVWPRIMEMYHDTGPAGHLGVTGTLDLVSRYYWKPGLTQYVKRYVEGCRECRRAKHKNQRMAGKLQPLPVPSGPWQWIQSDFVGPLPESKGKIAIYVVTDRLTKMVHFIPCTMKTTAVDLAKLHIANVWKLHGVPLVHNTDRGSTFKAEYTKQLNMALGIETQLSSAYHPQTQGQVENLNKWMEMYLRIFCGQRQQDWVEWLPLAEFAYNNHTHPTTETSPFYANYRYHPTMSNIPLEGQKENTHERVEQIKKVQGQLEGAILKAQEAQKRAYDQWKNSTPTYAVGEKVWLV
jgi:transposase InsO family protein